MRELVDVLEAERPLVDILKVRTGSSEDELERQRRRPRGRRRVLLPDGAAPPGRVADRVAARRVESPTVFLVVGV